MAAPMVSGDTASGDTASVGAASADTASADTASAALAAAVSAAAAWTVWLLSEADPGARRAFPRPGRRRARQPSRRAGASVVWSAHSAGGSGRPFRRWILIPAN